MCNALAYGVEQEECKFKELTPLKAIETHAHISHALERASWALAETKIGDAASTLTVFYRAGIYMALRLGQQRQNE